METISDLDESDQTPGMKKHTGVEVGTRAQQPTVVHFGLRTTGVFTVLFTACSLFKTSGDLESFMIRSPQVYCLGATQK